MRQVSPRLLSLCVLLVLTPSLTLAQLGGDPTQNDPFARVQLIHNVAVTGPIDVYLDGVLWLDDMDFRSATPFLPVANGLHTLDITAGTDTLNHTPLWSGTLTLLNKDHYVVAAQGYASEMHLTVRPDVRQTSRSGEAEFFILHGSPDTGPLDIRLLDPTQHNAVLSLLQNNLLFGQSGIYYHVSPGLYNFEVTNADNSLVLDTYYFDLIGLRGRTFVLLSSGPGKSSQEGFSLVAYDEHGDRLLPAVTTTSVGEATEIPSAFALAQNYPNPFNPTTRIRYAVPQAASVRLSVYDLLGRRLRTLVDDHQPAGTYVVTWDARTDAGVPAPSGTYLYRLEAGAFSEARTMVLAR